MITNIFGAVYLPSPNLINMSQTPDPIYPHSNGILVQRTWVPQERRLHISTMCHGSGRHCATVYVYRVRLW